jgi:hypothetical protein
MLFFADCRKFRMYDAGARAVNIFVPNFLKNLLSVSKSETQDTSTDRQGWRDMFFMYGRTVDWPITALFNVTGHPESILVQILWAHFLWNLLLKIRVLARYFSSFVLTSLYYAEFAVFTFCPQPATRRLPSKTHTLTRAIPSTFRLLCVSPRPLSGRTLLLSFSPKLNTV